MSFIFSALLLAATVYGFWSLLRVVFSKKRKQAAGRLLVCILVVVGSALALSATLDPATLYGGFATAEERRLAREAGVTDPVHWAENRDAILADLDAARAAEAAERAAAEAEAEKQREQQQAEQARLAAAEAAQCRQTLSCWGEKVGYQAHSECKRHIERLARYDVEWEDGFLDPAFTHYRWADREAGTVTIIGDKIKFQNGFGAWQNHIYECDVLPEADLVLEVRAQPGRL